MTHRISDAQALQVSADVCIFILLNSSRFISCFVAALNEGFLLFKLASLFYRWSERHDLMFGIGSFLKAGRMRIFVLRNTSGRRDSELP